jgi:ketosteroid isomerase-like protein
MYVAIVRRIVRNGFRALSMGNYEQVLQQFHPQVVLSFAGSSPIGGEHHGIDAARAWFAQLFSLFPGVQFTVHDVIVQGWPWNTYVATRFSLTAPHSDGSPYENEGMQFLRLRWGKVMEDRLYEDTQKLERELQRRKHAHRVSEKGLF